MQDDTAAIYGARPLDAYPFSNDAISPYDPMAIHSMAVLYKGRKRETGAVSSDGKAVEAISFEDLRDSMVEILDISPKEIDDLRDQLVDQHGNVPPHKVLWLRDRYAKRYNAIMRDTEDAIQNERK